jgi:excisionase family DNA binding protein
MSTVATNQKIQVSLAEAAELVDVSVTYLRREVTSGRLPAKLLGDSAKYRIRVEDLDAWSRNQKDA